jgi:RIO kinase 1
MLLRDVANLRDFFGQFAPELLQTHYGPEIWDLYQRGLLSADVSLSGQFKAKGGAVDVRSLMREIDDARAEDAARRLRMQTTS